jgi:predicted CopG family antitoxin
MGNMTLAIPDDLGKRMKRHREIRWSEVARRAIEQKVGDLELLDKLAAKSTLTKKDVADLSRKINRRATEKFLA